MSPLTQQQCVKVSRTDLPAVRSRDTHPIPSVSADFGARVPRCALLDGRHRTMHGAARLALVPPDEVPIPPCCSETATLDQVQEGVDDSNSLVLLPEIDPSLGAPLQRRCRSSAAPAEGRSTNSSSWEGCSPDVPTEVLTFCVPPGTLELSSSVWEGAEADAGESLPPPPDRSPVYNGSPRWEANKEAWYSGDQSGVSLLDAVVASVVTPLAEVEGTVPPIVHHRDNTLVAAAIAHVESLELRQRELERETESPQRELKLGSSLPAPEFSPGTGFATFLPNQEAHADQPSSYCWNPFTFVDDVAEGSDAEVVARISKTRHQNVVNSSAAAEQPPWSPPSSPHARAI